MPDFLAQTQAARKILLLELAGLGDLVHSLPSIWAIRKAYPQAELHCLTQSRNASLLRLTPWIDRVLPYERGGLSALPQYLRAASLLRAEHYDVVIELTGSEHACVVGRVSGAPRRLVRRAGDAKRRHGWRRLSTDVMEYPFGLEPMYLQRWHCLAQAGITSGRPEFQLARDFDTPDVPGAGAATRGYIHVSPYTKLRRKELPPAQTAQLLIRLNQALPHLKLAVSCGTLPREQSALRDLLKRLPFAPWQVFPGTLDIPALCALIRGAVLHLSGDSGSMHLAWLMGTPSVSWFGPSRKFRQWAPQGPRHALVFAATPATDYLDGVDIHEVLMRSAELTGEMLATRNPTSAVVEDCLDENLVPLAV